MNAADILAILQLTESALAAIPQIKADLSATDAASIQAAVTRSGAALDAARAQLDADAAG